MWKITEGIRRTKREEGEKEKEKKLKGGARKGDWHPGVGIASISDTRIKEEFIHDPGPSQPRANFVLADARGVRQLIHETYPLVLLAARFTSDKDSDEELPP